jgi:membrane protease YdiL (CAAX protease family)
VVVSVSVSNENLRREYVEATMVFGIYMVIYSLWHKVNDSLWAYSSMLAWVAGLSVFVVASLSLLFVMEIVVRRRRLSAVGFRLPTNRRALLVFIGVAAFLLIGGIIIHTVSNIRYAYLNQYFISGVIFGPLIEEIVFRGLIQTRLEAWLGTTKSWILSSLVFGFYHFLAWFLMGGKMLTTYSLTQLVWVVILGIMTGFFFAKTRSLLPPFLLHAVNNFVAFLL